MRRMAREGITQGDVQSRANRRHWADPRCRPNERGHVVAFACWQGWQAWLLAGAERFRLRVFRSMSPYERRERLRLFHLYIAESRGCDRPRLPG